MGPLQQLLFTYMKTAAQTPEEFVAQEREAVARELRRKVTEQKIMHQNLATLKSTAKPADPAAHAAQIQRLESDIAHHAYDMERLGANMMKPPTAPPRPNNPPQQLNPKQLEMRQQLDAMHAATDASLARDAELRKKMQATGTQVSAPVTTGAKSTPAPRNTGAPPPAPRNTGAPPPTAGGAAASSAGGGNAAGATRGFWGQNTWQRNLALTGIGLGAAGLGYGLYRQLREPDYSRELDFFQHPPTEEQ